MTEKYPLEKIISDPIGAYEEFRIRLDKYGHLAPFPEFEESVEFLIKTINDERVIQVTKDNPSLILEKEEVLTFLFHVNLKFSTDTGINYPYSEPFKEPYPYRPTIDAIESAIRFLDKVSRLTINNKAVKLYHFDRYCYHRHSILASNEVIIFPTFKELGMMDFIKTRCVPIEFVGIIPDTLRVDGHNQSPLDFWYHDFNHARRLLAYINKRCNELDYDTPLEKYRYFRRMSEYTKDVVIDKLCDIKIDDDEEMQSIKKINTITIFEILHETALTVEKESLVEDLQRRTGPQPFEYMNDENTGLDYESLRTPLGNIMSGASHKIKQNIRGSNIRYFLDNTSIGLLANVYNKINHYYYDDVDGLNEEMLKPKYRTKEFLAKATKHMLDIIDTDNKVTIDELLDIISDTDKAKEKSLLRAVSDEISQTQTGTEPLTSIEAISMIRSENTDKKILSFFGYSALGYENYEDLLATIRNELSRYSPKEYVICAGATEEGIGIVYKIASQMGFSTIGIVSTLALSYSGKFSEFVNRIYIINDNNWGGYKHNTNTLTETTNTFINVTNEFIALGGGNNTLVTLENAKKLDIPFKYLPFEMKYNSPSINDSDKLNGYLGAAYNILK